MLALAIVATVGFGWHRGASAASVTAAGLAADRIVLPPPPNPLLLIIVNDVGDLGRATTGCDSDAIAPGDQCTLRAALDVAASVTDDVVIHFSFDASQLDPTGRATINLTHALQTLTKNISIEGPGADLLTVRRSTGDNYRIFTVTTPGVVSFSGLTISNGHDTNDTTGRGAAIQSTTAGTVTITDCVFSDDVAFLGGALYNESGTMHVSGSTFTRNTANGSAIHNLGTMDVVNSVFTANVGVFGAIEDLGSMTVTGSTFSDNVSMSTFGGAIYLATDGGTLDVIGTTISGNSATLGGGGLAVSAGTANVIDSTINDNSGGQGGGILNDGLGTVNVTNSTIFHNSAGFGGGIDNEFSGTINLTNSTVVGNTVTGNAGGLNNNGSGVFTVKSSIIALNSADGSGPDVFGSFQSGGFNLVGIDLNTGFSLASDHRGGSLSPLDPKLDGRNLQFNGAGIKTLAPLCGSPTIDAGSSDGLTGSLTTDERGGAFTRTFDDPATQNAAGSDGTDIGAFELQQSCTSAPGATPMPTPGTLDDFVAYGVKTTKGTAPFVPLGPVTLSDASGAHDYDVGKPLALGLPADVDGRGRHDVTTHLLEYGLKPSKGAAKVAPRVGVHLVNPCSDVLVATTKPVSVLVPTAKDPTNPVTPPVEAGHQVDHFLCYKAKAATKLPKGVQVDATDQFQLRRYDLKAISKLCLPVAKNGQPAFLKGDGKGTPFALTPSTLRHADEVLVCYGAKLASKIIPQVGCGPADPKAKGTKIDPKQPKHSPQHGLFVANQLGALRLDSVKERELCVPSLVGP